MFDARNKLHGKINGKDKVVPEFNYLSTTP
jgi:hypothetical protein